MAKIPGFQIIAMITRNPVKIDLKQSYPTSAIANTVFIQKTWKKNNEFSICQNREAKQ